MAILVDPLFSDEARGQVAKVAVFKRGAVHPVFAGFSYHPMNWTPAKVAQAQTWKALCTGWRALPAADKVVWAEAAPGVLTGFNYFMQLKGVWPFPPCYIPPDGDELVYDFVAGDYTAPGGAWGWGGIAAYAIGCDSLTSSRGHTVPVSWFVPYCVYMRGDIRHVSFWTWEC